MSVVDTLGRPLRNLRLSVTDRCNLRCAYCMPEEEYRWLPREDILHFEEISRLVDVFAELGVDKVRLTGGEPLMRRDLSVLIRMLAAKPAIKDLALTTNGVMLAPLARSLLDAGLHRVTVSLDTLRPDTFQSLTRRDELAAVLAGIESVVRAGFMGTKLDAVIMRGVNDDELVSLLEYGKSVGAEVRFIEYMDVGGATQWSAEKVVSRDQMLEVLAAHYGAVTPRPEDNSAPADRYVLPDGTVFGIISSTTAPFCRACDRSRLTADGLWFMCLYAAVGTDLRRALRNAATVDELKDLIAGRWRQRRDRGAEDRLAAHARGALVPAKQLQRDPHLEMHTRGG